MIRAALRAVHECFRAVVIVALVIGAAVLVSLGDFEDDLED